jgi:hypothetical protein
MYSTAEWDARIEPDGSVWLTIPGDPILMEIMLDKASGAKGGARL